jgi:hypothetical protein
LGKGEECLNVFFPSYAFSSFDHQKLFEAAFLPILRAFLDHTVHVSKERDVTLADIGKFFIYLTDRNNLPEK